MLTAGLQVPVTPLVDVVGRTGAADPLQIAGTAVKVGTVCAFMVTVKVVGTPHCPGAGVNV